MRRAVSIAALVAALMVVPASASAAYYIPQRTAESHARQVVHEEFTGFDRTSAFCRPKGIFGDGASGPLIPPGARYHRWVCVVTDPYDSCPDPEPYGVMGVGISIAGSSVVGRFYWHVWHGIDCFGD
jgi:hypothetical protein